MREQLLDPRHRVPVVRVRLVPLEHRELGVVLERDAFVAEVLAELVYLVQPTDDQPLEIELGRDAKVVVGVVLVVVRYERAREGASVPRLKHRRLDFDEPLRVEIGANRRHDPRPRDERGRVSSFISRSRWRCR